MSGIMEEARTPCPPELRPSRGSSGSDASDSLWGDALGYANETTNLDFTTQIKKPTLMAVKPRRRTKTGTSFAIRDDNEGCLAEALSKKARENKAAATAASRRSLLVQPAQRFPPKACFTSSPASKLSCEKKGPKLKEQSVESSAEANRSLLMQINGGNRDRHKDLFKRNVHQNTIFIPPEDATVASVFMDMFSPLKDNNTTYIIQDNTEINSLEARIVRKRQAKKAMGSSRKVPLQASVKISQENAIRVDIAGKKTGKENVPPGTVLFNAKNKALYKETGDQPRSDLRKRQGYEIPSSPQPMDKPTTKPIQGRQKSVLGEKCSNTRNSVVNVDGKVNDMIKTRSKLEGSDSSMSRRSNPAKILEESGVYKDAILRGTAQSASEEHALIMDDITSLAMCEDNWLTYQEIVITQIINGLFDHVSDKTKYDDSAMLKHTLLQLYQSEPFMQLHRRLQASLSCGNMSIPKDALTQARQLRQDLGMKRKFLDIWLETYDVQALKAAVEAVTGRKIANKPMPLGDNPGRSLDTSSLADTERILRKRLERFLDVFFVQNKDMDRDGQSATDGDSDMVVQAYRRTILRSIMLVVLLDQARCCPGTMVPSSLFLTTSPFKSSAAVMQNLARLLLPASGDIIETLGYLGCHLFYKQHPLQEYDYRMKNLAVDLRDGIRLTKIVELLLYPSFDVAEQQLASLSDENEPWPLSRDLKFPCLSRAVKMYNVQIALDALASSHDSAKFLHGIAAEDIVNGHREKTVALLWELVEWGEVTTEIKRLREKTISRCEYQDLHELDHPQKESPGHSTENDDEVTLLLKQF